MKGAVKCLLQISVLTAFLLSGAISAQSVVFAEEPELAASEEEPETVVCMEMDEKVLLTITEELTESYSTGEHVVTVEVTLIPTDTVEQIIGLLSQ